jgi:hypothetical protein
MFWRASKSENRLQGEAMSRSSCSAGWLYKSSTSPLFRLSHCSLLSIPKKPLFEFDVLSHSKVGETPSLCLPPDFGSSAAPSTQNLTASTIWKWETFPIAKATTKRSYVFGSKLTTLLGMESSWSRDVRMGNRGPGCNARKPVDDRDMKTSGRLQCLIICTKPRLCTSKQDTNRTMFPRSRV